MSMENNNLPNNVTASAFTAHLTHALEETLNKHFGHLNPVVVNEQIGIDNIKAVMFESFMGGVAMTSNAINSGWTAFGPAIVTDMLQQTVLQDPSSTENNEINFESDNDD